MDQRYIREQNRNRQMAQKLAQRGVGAQGLNEKFESGIMSGMKPGNVGEINRVIWPFFFNFQPENGSAGDIIPGASATLTFSVSQEAGFLMRQISQACFRKVGTNYEYVDPFYFDESANSANGLVYTIEDAQSTRVFNGRVSEEISMLGNASFPRIYPSTVFLLPNQTMLINITNNNPTETFRPYVTVMGYRVRVENAQEILSTVSG